MLRRKGMMEGFGRYRRPRNCEDELRGLDRSSAGFWVIRIGEMASREVAKKEEEG